MNARGLAACLALGVFGAPGAHAAVWSGAHLHGPLSLVMVAEDTAPKDSSEAAAPAADEEKGRGYLGNEPLEACMNRWDPGTHMTKDAWRESCKRITEERGPYVKGR